MRYGFAIDQRTCIGCHACTVACKTEHEVPVGQFRTWVKYVDSGTFPDTRRSFGVMRCNHCTDAPCVTICPTQALFKRDDGIVDFDSDRCIGCKSCLQACPYDALYIDENTHTAAKCNMCAHRVDADLEPACVIVCPTQSIWIGDLDDPESAISRFVAHEETAVRSPEQETSPNVFYVGADRAVLDPLAAPVDDTYLWAEPDPQRLLTQGDLTPDPTTRPRTTLNTAHPRPWGWRVTTYLWTKGVGAGAMALALIAWITGVDLGGLGSVAAPILGVLGAAVTGVLLVADLKRPDRFYFLLTKPHLTSWLVWGGLALSVFAAGSVVWLLLGFSDLDVLRTVVAWIGLPVAALMAGYTAFLFGQAEGRDLWQSPLLFWHLLAQAVMVGGGGLAVVAAFGSSAPATRDLLPAAITLGIAAHLLLLAAEYGRRHPSRQAAIAARQITHGRYRRQFWLGAVLPAAVAGVLAATTWTGAPFALLVVAGLLVQPALLAYESCYVRAGQDPPLS